MNGKVSKLFGLVMVLVLAVSLSGIGLIQAGGTASAITALKWTPVETPRLDNFQLYPYSNVGPIDVTPDGEMLFASVYDEMAGDWHVYKSRDGGYTWSETNFWQDVVNSGPVDTSRVMDLHVSPNWEFDDHVFVATQNAVYRSYDRGNTWDVLGDSTDHGGNIICMDVGVDRNNNWTVVIGTGLYDPTLMTATTNGAGFAGADVYLLVYADWVPQQVDAGLYWGGGTPSETCAVLDVAFAPTYGDEAMAGAGYNWIYAIVRIIDSAPPVLLYNRTLLRCETQPVTSPGDVGNWGSPVSDAHFIHDGAPECSTFGITAIHGVMAFADDYADQQAVFVGLVAYACNSALGDTPPPDGEPRGDLFRVDKNAQIILPSTVTDLDVRGEDTECNIFSLDVDGDADSAYILVGLRETSTSATPTAWESGVHWSSNGGDTFLQSYKPPSGLAELLSQTNFTWLVMAPDFSTSGIAYAGTWGYFSGFWATPEEGLYWNGRGLLDFLGPTAVGTSLTSLGPYGISSIAPSPNYVSDGNMFMVTFEDYDNFGVTDIGLVWETKDYGAHWEIILAMNALFPLPGVAFQWIELPDDWPADDSICVTGHNAASLTAGPPGAVQSIIIQSGDGGNTWTNFINGPEEASVPLPPNPLTFGRSWDVADISTIFIGDANGDVHYTDDGGFSWWTAIDTAIPNGDAITDLLEMDGSILVGTENGDVYVCYDWQDDFAFERVGTGPGNDDDWVTVAFDAYYDLNDMIYCALDDYGGGGSEVWRFDLGASVWEQISDIAQANSPQEWWADEDITEIWATVHGEIPMLVNSLKCAEDGTLYALDWNLNNLVWRSVEPATEEPIVLGETPLFEPMWNGLGWPVLTGATPSDKGVLWDLEVVPGSNQLFAVGYNDLGEWTIWTYYDTLTREKGPIDLVRPDDGAVGVGTPSQDNTRACMVLEWERAEGATKYEWEIGLDPQFNTKVAHHQFLGEDLSEEDTQRFTNGQAIQGCLWPADTFYWHVRVVEPFLSPWSDTWSFTTLYLTASERPVLTWPVGGTTNVSLKPALEWQSAMDADGYELIVAEECNWASPVIEKTGGNALGAETAYQVTTTLKQGTNYCWKVKAVKGSSESAWSDTGTFTTLTIPDEPEEEGTPYWVWVVIGVSALMLVAVIVLIVMTKKA